MRRLALAVAAAGLLALPACIHHQVTVDPIDIKVEKIQANVDINLRVDRALDDFFDFEEKYEEPKKTEDTGGK
jgi:hypothetical protein